MKYISGNSSATISDLDTLAQTASSYGSIYNGYSSANMRSNTLSAGTEGSVSYVAKSSSQDIQVKLGDLNWECVYLSKDKNGDTILTLWLDNQVQSAWSSRSSTEGDYYGFYNGGLYSDFSADWYSNMYNWNNLYGSSYINSVTLNNGGAYYTSETKTTSTATQSEDSAFALFTMSQYCLTDFLITPRNISWQEYQSSKTILGKYYDQSNDAWSQDMPSDGFYSSSYNYAGMSYNDAWADSYLWLPSCPEVYSNGLWKTSDAQLANDYYSYSDIGSSNTVDIDYDGSTRKTWTRSSINHPANVTVIYYDGSSFKSGISDRVSYAIAVRPALHLNLSKIMAIAYDGVISEELYNEDTQTFNEDAVSVIMKYISGNSNATISTLDTLAQTSSSYGSIYTGYSAGNMRTNTVSAGTTGGVSYGAKTSGQDIVVTLGGLKWQVQYLSKDKSGNTILTLWLDNCEQDAWEDKLNERFGRYYFRYGGLYGSWSYGWAEFDGAGNADYPSNMYGTSYMNAVVLNNGGYYATDVDELSTYQNPSTSSVFALYTMPQYGLTDYLVTPRNVSWQESQSAKNVVGFSYNLSNDAWSLDTPDTGFRPEDDEGSHNYAIIDESDDWADSYLWLPSITETGYSASYSGIWESSATQRQNLATYGTSNNYDYSWLRSALDARGHCAYSLYSSGVANYYAYAVSTFRAVRPALHLNLTKIVESFDNSTYVQVGELFDEETKSINYTNLDIMYMYLTGDVSLSYDAFVGRNYNSTTYRTSTLSAGTINGVEYKAKKAGQDVVVRLGGLDWYVVANNDQNDTVYLTFYLKGGGQEKWLDTSKYTSTAGEYYGFIDGILYADWSANFQSTNLSNAYPSNMYGTSYMNAVVLNNGGTYATNNTTSTSATQSSTNPFALYTMASGGLTKYLTNTWGSRDFGLWANCGGDMNIFTQIIHPNEDTENLEPTRYTSKTGYTAWGLSYLWLPSALHTTYAWELSDAQNANGDLTDSFSIMGTVGTKGENAYASSWLRTGHGSRAYMAYTMLADGTGYGTSGVGSAHAVRPALYFNLTAVEADRPSASAVSVESLGQKIFESNSYVSFNDVAMTYKKTA